MTLIKVLMIAGLAGVAFSPSALAQKAAPHETPCAERAHVAEKLRETFGERMVGSGLTDSGVLFELYVGPASTWTLLATTPAGVSCLVGAGEAWEPLPSPDIFVAR
ncbi:hypothetical protein [Bosea sp. TAF32]|uniref:hypothetical protein n=1 Tax=Bosea sp. TAF32 TaxID=3237482 RepID=UPI003F90326D